MLGVSQGQIVKFKQQVDRMTAKAKAVMQKADAAVATVITTSEISAASFLFGLAQGKFGGIAVVGVPVDLLAGLGLHILGFAGIGGRNAHHLHAFGDGALASFFNKLGSDVGVSIRTPADEARIAKQKSGVKGDLSGLTGGAALADEELARMVAAGRR
jgi:hypothetical protein